MVRRRILTSAAVGLLLALVVAIVGQVYAAGLPDQYTAQSVVLFGSRPTENGSIASSDSVQAAAAGYVAYLSAPSTLREVADGIGESPAVLKDGLTVTQLPATGTIRIDFETTDPDRAARASNALATSMAARTVSDPVVYGQVLARAAVPLQPSGPPRTILLVATILVALLLGAGAATAAWAAPTYLGRRRGTGLHDSATHPVDAGAVVAAPVVAAATTPVEARPVAPTATASEAAPQPTDDAVARRLAAATAPHQAVGHHQDEAVATDENSSAAAQDEAADQADDAATAPTDSATDGEGAQQAHHEADGTDEADETAVAHLPGLNGSASRPGQGAPRGPRRRTTKARKNR
ncbi:hypothetical protein [Phycicoccus duodecadis]|uniref:Capsular polysaccharide biosynthesis protein n=1 Tax=Phycicoccus duodecadis TaxID=173053 RepID=A0A2N3YIP2_9MICO|nr:hypothetical protein [Phycicoccus duodecadis]PKW26715.1 capsular polysaccharide biosynthesis protein [Phycicoccus duodecadis]